jgi:hypothetical protein
MIIGMIGATSLLASTRGDVKVIEASENIRYLGQKISKEYLLLYHNPKKREIQERLYRDIESMERSISDISSITNSKDSKNILDFLIYNQEEIKSLLKEKVDREKSILMLDYSESFLEAANSIEDAHEYAFSKEEKMLMVFKEIEYLLERALKYYIASTLEIDKVNNRNNMEQAINNINQNLEKINHYPYPDNLLKSVKEMNSSWETYKKYLYRSTDLFVPNLLLSSMGTLREMTKKIALYHKKNQ